MRHSQRRNKGEVSERDGLEGRTLIFFGFRIFQSSSMLPVCTDSVSINTCKYEDDVASLLHNVSRVKPESGQTFADEPARTPELRSEREVQYTHNEARITRCRMFWGVLVGLQARLCKSRGVSTERQSGHSRDTSCGAHVTAFHTLLCNTKLPTTILKSLMCSNALANGSGAAQLGPAGPSWAQRYTEGCCRWHSAASTTGAHKPCSALQAHAKVS